MEPHHIEDVLFTESQIQQRVQELVVEMSEDLRDRNLVVIGILRGSFIFLADLCRRLFHERIHPKIDFMTLQSYYGGMTSSGAVRIAKDFSENVEHAHVLVIDDILDTGRTIRAAAEHIRGRGAEHIKTCALLDKPSRRVEPFAADYVGFEIPDVFVVGYGLDYDNHYRELPYIATVALKEPGLSLAKS